MIRTDDDFPYYLVKLRKDLFLTDSNVKDDYGQTFLPMTKVIAGNYYEHFKQVKEGDLYYLDQTKTAVISCFNVAGVCPELSEIEQQRRGKNKQMGLVTHELHQALSEYNVYFTFFVIP